MNDPPIAAKTVLRVFQSFASRTTPGPLCTPAACRRRSPLVGIGYGSGFSTDAIEQAEDRGRDASCPVRNAQHRKRVDGANPGQRAPARRRPAGFESWRPVRRRLSGRCGPGATSRIRRANVTAGVCSVNITGPGGTDVRLSAASRCRRGGVSNRGSHQEACRPRRAARRQSSRKSREKAVQADTLPGRLASCPGTPSTAARRGRVGLHDPQIQLHRPPPRRRGSGRRATSGDTAAYRPRQWAARWSPLPVARSIVTMPSSSRPARCPSHEGSR